MSIEMYVYIALVFVSWIILTNLVKVSLQSRVESNDEYTYYIEINLISYNEGTIVCESWKHDIYTFDDRDCRWADVVNSSIGCKARIQYNVAYHGFLFISFDTKIVNIEIIHDQY